MENKSINKGYEIKQQARVLKGMEDAKKERSKNEVTLEQIHIDLISLAQYVYKERPIADNILVFKGEVYHALSQLNIKLLTYREKHE